MYIVTSEGGDHNGAFEGLEGGSKQQGFWSMCARLLQMSELYNVVSWFGEKARALKATFLNELELSIAGLPCHSSKKDPEPEVYKRVENLNEATTFVHDVKKGGHFGEAIKHVTISGHGNPSTLVLGDDRLTSRELVSKHDTDSKELLKRVLYQYQDAHATICIQYCTCSSIQYNGYYAYMV